MNDAYAEHYRNVLAIHDGIKDPLIMVKTDHLRALLDVWEWYTAGERPRIRVKATKAV